MPPRKNQTNQERKFTRRKNYQSRSTSRKKKKEIEDLNLTLKSVTTQKDEKGTDPKSALYVFYK
ncbi:uncharacterized protein LOC143242831 isoform X1 [Tachypleus tridentatus]|uniref:uncharacterized protein LOC143242831 isoform X1 n=1 Tax=Tachypleus tridentatus TaxID=6853 RepID=UPI003FCFEC82